MKCKDCLHCNYSWCKETADDFYKIHVDNPACEEFTPKDKCNACIWCIRKDGKYWCKYNFPKDCLLYAKAEIRASKDGNIWPPRRRYNG